MASPPAGSEGAIQTRMSEDLFPGAGLPMDWLPEKYSRSGLDEWGFDLLAVREQHMIALMNAITDRAEWTEKIYDDESIQKWLEDTRASPESLLDDEHFDYCIEELKFKAATYRKTNLVVALDAQFRIVKSDAIVPVTIQEDLKKACVQLKRAREPPADWQSATDRLIQDLIDPSLYPLSYGISRKTKRETPTVDSRNWRLESLQRQAGKGDLLEFEEEQPSYYSRFYQWLPCQVSFVEDKVSIDSIVNNLHPRRHSAVYPVLERLIAAAMPAWEACLVTKASDSEYEHRLSLEGCEWSPGHDEYISSNIGPDKVADGGLICDTHGVHEIRGVHDTQLCDQWRSIRTLIQPRARLSVAKRQAHIRNQPVSLRERFGDSGLQVIVKMTSIELNRDYPTWGRDPWHTDGKLNEHICASAHYCFDSENISGVHFAFGQLIHPREAGRLAHPYADRPEFPSHLEKIFDIDLTGVVGSQNIGKVETRSGRLIAFPNLMFQRLSRVELADRSKPGHYRYVTLMLVDPNIRIMSTAEVAPPQQSWWVEETLRTTHPPKTSIEILLGIFSYSRAGSKLPAEIVQVIADELDTSQEWMMGEETARMRRDDMRDDRMMSGYRLSSSVLRFWE